MTEGREKDRRELLEKKDARSGARKIIRARETEGKTKKQKQRQREEKRERQE